MKTTPPHPHPRPSGPEDAFTVLVVESDDWICDCLAKALELLGCRVLAAPDVDAGRRIATSSKHRKIDLLLTDHRMPLVRGDEFAICFNAIHPRAAIIIMSLERPTVPASLRCEFLAKPFRLDELRTTVRAIMARMVDAPAPGRPEGHSGIA